MNTTNTFICWACHKMILKMTVNWNSRILKPRTKNLMVVTLLCLFMKASKYSVGREKLSDLELSSHCYGGFNIMAEIWHTKAQQAKVWVLVCNFTSSYLITLKAYSILLYGVSFLKLVFVSGFVFFFKETVLLSNKGRSVLCDVRELSTNLLLGCQ